MKQLSLICLFISSTFLISAQDPFSVGLSYYEKGMYSKADSVFCILNKESPEDKNVLFNLGITRLIMGDTCRFCNVMLNLCHSYLEMDACNFYFSICGSIDTIYRDKKYLVCNKENARFTETIETHNNEDFKTVYIHDKRKKGASHIMNADFMNPINTDIIAVYRLFNDSSKIFLFTLTPPAFLDDSEYHIYMEDNPFVRLCKEKLNLSNIKVNFTYVVDKENNIKDIKIVDIITPDTENTNSKDTFYDLFRYKNITVEKMDLLKQFIDLIVNGMPSRTCGKYRGINVDYLVHDVINI